MKKFLIMTISILIGYFGIINYKESSISDIYEKDKKYNVI